MNQLHNHVTTCRLPFYQNEEGTQTSLSTVLRISAFFLGLIGLTIGILIVTRSLGNLGSTYGWSILSGSIILVVASMFKKSTIQKEKPNLIDPKRPITTRNQTQTLEKKKGQSMGFQIPLDPKEFLVWLKEDIKSLDKGEGIWNRLVGIIKNKEVTLEAIREFYAGLDSDIVLDILFCTQTEDSFNAVEEKIIKKTLLTETCFIKKINEEYPHHDPILRQEIKEKTLGASILQFSMGEKEIITTCTEFLDGLKNSGRLLDYEEFEMSSCRSQYMYKNYGIDRLLGADYIKKTAKGLNLKHIKVPNKIVVIDREIDEEINGLHVTVEKTGLLLCCPKLITYAEIIVPLQRSTTRDELRELLDIIETTGFSSFIGRNFFLGKNQAGEEGIYFIDTEYTNFRYGPFSENNFAKSMDTMVRKEDVQWINAVEQVPSYRRRSEDAAQRHMQLHHIEERNIGTLQKTYVAEDQTLKKEVEFTYPYNHRK